MDCMELIQQYPDKYFELAIVDPPYGIKMHGGRTYASPKRPNLYGKPPKHATKQWDNNRPNAEYFAELRRVSRNQIIWGANYFVEYLTPSMGWIYWGKMEDTSNFSDGELAYTSFNRALKSYKLNQHAGTHGGKDRIHPTQKPVALYKWILVNYAQEGDKILDTHLGSGSIAIACHDLKFSLTACELDADYFAAMQKRVEQHLAQQTLF